jgi:predicted N-acetyltransferase YhbS
MLVARRAGDPFHLNPATMLRLRAAARALRRRRRATLIEAHSAAALPIAADRLAMKDAFAIRLEEPADAAAIEALQAAAFGPGAYARAAFRVREQAPHDTALSFVGLLGNRLIASVRLTPVRVGEARGLLLGPLVVDPPEKSRGYGRALVRHALAEAAARGHAFVILVGDEPYYGPLGFARMAPGRVRIPGPVDPARLLVAELKQGAAAGLEGMVAGEWPAG